MIIILKTRKSSVRVVRAGFDVTRKAWKQSTSTKGEKNNREEKTDRRAAGRKCPLNVSGKFNFIYALYM